VKSPLEALLPSQFLIRSKRIAESKDGANQAVPNNPLLRPVLGAAARFPASDVQGIPDEILQRPGLDVSALARGVDIIVGHTHTCYTADRANRHAWGYGCGQCPACILRAQGWERWQTDRS
jgi:queuosine biosynthesis protein QueC